MGSGESAMRSYPSGTAGRSLSLAVFCTVDTGTLSRPRTAGKDGRATHSPIPGDRIGGISSRAAARIAFARPLCYTRAAIDLHLSEGNEGDRMTRSFPTALWA